MEVEQDIPDDDNTDNLDDQQMDVELGDGCIQNIPDT